MQPPYELAWEPSARAYWSTLTWLVPTKPQPCRYCGIGFYRRLVDPRGPQNHAVAVEEFGLPRPPHAGQWMITARTHCRNVQCFRLDKMDDPKRWHLERQGGR